MLRNMSQIICKFYRKSQLKIHLALLLQRCVAENSKKYCANKGENKDISFTEDNYLCTLKKTFNNLKFKLPVGKVEPKGKS